MLGFFPRAQLEGYIDNGWVLIAEDAASGERVGYVTSRDRYLKRDELGVIYQLCVSPGTQRKLIGATLLRSVFERSAYGCRLYCCWCAQDLAANRFWEAMGFEAIAFRGGSAKRGKNGRVHIFWQKRIRANDRATPWWFPAKTEGGAMREDRLVLPMPRGLRWDEAVPVLKTAAAVADAGVDAVSPKRASKRAPVTKAMPPTPRPRVTMQFGPPGASPIAVEQAKAIAATAELAAIQTTKLAKPKRAASKCDPRMIAAARELRDRWLEQVNAEAIVTSSGKYDVGRVIEDRPAPTRVITTQIHPQQRLLQAA